MPRFDPTIDRPGIGLDLVGALVAKQFPQWAVLPIRPVVPGGWDNRTFRLGEAMSLRFPSAARYVGAVDKEHEWLPRLAPHLPLPIPVPLARGRPDEGYPWPWSVYDWIEGEPARRDSIRDPVRFACDLAAFLNDLQSIDATSGPPAGAHNFFRGGPLSVYESEARSAILALDGAIDVAAATAVIDAALAAEWCGRPVWVHGDIAWGNLLVIGGQLAAVIDFGSSAVGDPSCDLAIAWTLFESGSRAAFRTALTHADPATWTRGSGWALWKALIMLVQNIGTGSAAEAEHRLVIERILADHRAAA